MIAGMKARTERKQDERDESDLIRSARAGDRDAFCELVQPFLSTLRSRVRRAVHNRSEIDPEEIVQETLIRSFQSLSIFDERHTFAQYLFGIARYATLRHVAERSREIAVDWHQGFSDEDAEVAHLPGTSQIPAAFHARALAMQFPPPDARVRERHRFRALFSAFLAYGGYPHQQVAFGFSVMLWGKQKAKEAVLLQRKRERPDKVDVTGDPTRVVQDLSDTLLEHAGRDFRTEIEAAERLDPRDLEDLFRPFDCRLSLLGKDLFAKDPASQAQFSSLAEERIGSTCLANYYGSDPRRSVADWSRAVKERLRKHFLGASDPALSHLPMPSNKGAHLAPP